MKQTQLNWISPKKSAGEPGGEIAGEALEVDPEILQESLEEDLNKVRKWVPAGTYRRKSGGRQSCAELGLQPRGKAGGFRSNRLYAGQVRRRKDYSAAEGVELCQQVLAMQEAGTTAAEVHQFLLRQSSSRGSRQKNVRSLKSVLKKGLKFWQGRLKQVEVGKHGLRRKGRTLKRACRTTESRGCRAPGGGRKDRFEGYKAVVKQIFTAELENGQEVGAVLVQCQGQVTGWSTWPSSAASALFCFSFLRFSFFHLDFRKVH